MRAFNARLRAAGGLLFPLTETAPVPNPNRPAPGIEFRHFVVLDESGEVRGGYFIRNQPFWIRGQVQAWDTTMLPCRKGPSTSATQRSGP